MTMKLWFSMVTFIALNVYLKMQQKKNVIRFLQILNGIAILLVANVFMHEHDYVILLKSKTEIWCIQKVSRYSENPCPYDGPAIRNAGIKARYYLNKNEALRDAKIITEYNPVGFSVVKAKKLHSDYPVK